MRVRTNSAFTLIELLVVISVIALLMAILMPALARARKQAMRVRCATRLRNWGQAIVLYGADNDERLMKIVSRWGSWYPHFISAETVGSAEGEWNLNGINPYIRGFSDAYLANGRVNEMVSCPAISSKHIQRWITEVVFANNQDFAEIAYSYFGMAQEIDETQRSQNALLHLTNKLLAANRLLMADILYLDTSEKGYRYNHGRSSWSYEVGDRPIVRSPNPEATGRNQLFGDGHVTWKKIPQNANLPTDEDRFQAQWNGVQSGWVSQYDTSYF